METGGRALATPGDSPTKAEGNVVPAKAGAGAPETPAAVQVRAAFGPGGAAPSSGSRLLFPRPPPSPFASSPHRMPSRARATQRGPRGGGLTARRGPRARPGSQSGASGFTPLRRQKQTRSPRGPRGGSAVQKPLPPRPQRARERPAVSTALGRTRGVPVPRVRALRPAPAPCPQHGVLLTTSFQGRVRSSACKAYFSGPPKLR